MIQCVVCEDWFHGRVRKAFAFKSHCLHKKRKDPFFLNCVIFYITITHLKIDYKDMISVLLQCTLIFVYKIMSILDNLEIARKIFDFLYSQHLGAIPPESGDFQEMVCQACMKRCSFLWAYAAQLAGMCLCGVGVPQSCACKICMFSRECLATVFTWTLRSGKEV